MTTTPTPPRRRVVRFNLWTSPRFDALLAQVDTRGLDYQIRLPAGSGGAAAMPRIAGLGSLAAAGPQELGFLANPKYTAQLASSTGRDGCCLCVRNLPQPVPALRARHAR